MRAGKVFFGEGGMDGNNILLVVSASLENYWFATSIHSSLHLFISLFFIPPFFPNPGYSLSPFLVLGYQSPSPPSTLPHPCVL